LTNHKYTAIPAMLGDEVPRDPPKYIPDDVDYVDGIVGF